MSDYFPTREGIVTELGTLTVWATSATHIGARGTLTVNRVEIQTRLDLHYLDGAWQRGDKDDWSAKYHALMTDRPWTDKGRPDVSSSAREKIEAFLVPWLAAYAEGDGAELVRDAGIKDSERKIESARAAIATKQAELADAEKALGDLT